MKAATWFSLCIKTDKGKLIPNVANALIALEHDPAIRDAFASARCAASRCSCTSPEFQWAAKCSNPAPSPRGRHRDPEMDAARRTEAHGPRGTVRDAINLYARDHAYHPVRDYLEACNGTATAHQRLADHQARR